MTTTRRRFLQTTATAVAATIVAPHVLGGPRYVAPSDKVNIALVGAGGQGRTNVRALFQEADAQVIAVADPIEEFSLDAFYYKDLGGRTPVRAEIEKHYAEKTPNYRCADYEDFRVMLEKEPAIDAVLCATPDHLHAYVSVIAMRAGKHVFCEKPLTHNVWEARQVAQVAKASGVATQMGNIGHSNVGIRLTCEWIWDGAIGPVREVHTWVAANRWNKQLTGRPTDTPPVPAGVNWDLWIGPRETAPVPSGLHARHLARFLGFRLAAAWAISAATIWTPPAGRSILFHPRVSKLGQPVTWTRTSCRTVRSATTTSVRAATKHR